jgi:hypothetical protein
LNDPQTTAPLAANALASGGGIGWLVHQLYTYGPGWAAVPPLLFSIAALIGTCIGAYEKWHKIQREKDRYRQWVIDRERARLRDFPTPDHLSGS